MAISKFAVTDGVFEKKFATLLRRGEMDMESVMPVVLELLSDIQKRGDDAVLEHIRRFDLWNPQSMHDVFVSKQEIEDAYHNLEPSLKDALHVAYERIFAFHSKQKQKSWIDFEYNGTILGQRIAPLERAGLYIPGGKASYPSSLLMNAIPAIVAGVKQIIVCSPALKGKVDSTLLAAAHLCKIETFCKVGGASAVALMAYGSKKLQKVDIITGPGNIFVATAKKCVFGRTKIDMIAGPSEIGIIADDSADPMYIALDMLSQAEHDELASAILITSDCNLAHDVSACIEKEILTLPRFDIARRSIDERGAIITTTSLEQCVELMNAIAPEHLEILTREPFMLLPFVKNAGAVFLGMYSPEVFGDYAAGPNHTLPTGGSARFFSPLGVEHFMKKSSIVALNKDGAMNLVNHCAILAEAEGLSAHARAALIREK